jgi:hypothetical protein
MISSTELIAAGAPDPGPNRWYVATVDAAGYDEDYGWGDSATILLGEMRTVTKTRGVFRRHTESVQEPAVVDRVFRTLPQLGTADEATPILVSMCKELVDRVAANEAHARAIAELVRRTR